MKTITILLIEDNTQDIRLIKEMLKEIRSFNYNLVSAVTLKEGCEQIQKNNFDIILLDLNLPDSTGQQTFQKVIDCCKEIPVVLITGNEDQELSVKLIMEGAQDYITKQSLNAASLEKSILYSIERQALLSNIKTQKAEITRIEKERILLAKFPSQDPDPVLRVAKNGMLLYINEAGIKLLPDWQLIINETIPSWLKDIIDPVFIEGANIEFELGHREFIYFFYAVPFIEDGYINLYGRDITERKRKEEELIIANKELAFQNEEKEKRADELIIANKELIFQKEEKEKRAEELIIAKEHAEESDRLKSAFLCNMSHEIRTPMNGILGFSELLKEPGLTGDQQQEYIRIIEKSGARMLNIINDIVDISKIEAGLMKVDIKDANINEKIEFIYTFFKFQVEEKGMQLFFRNTLPTKEAIIKSDSEKIYSILTNLVKNAIKYSKEGAIEFGYIKRDETLEFYVKDTGIGIPKNRQKAVFERFIQADITDKMARQGAGLGLSISKAYVEMLGGKIWVESEEGIGSTFYFTLPYNAEPVEKKVVGKVVLVQDKENQIKDLKILIAEDDETSEMLITIDVGKFSKEILKARNGFEAVEVCRNNPDTDLILMDIQMPVINGHEATRQIRQFNKDVVIIAQTAFGLSGDREKAIAAGCNDYIAKPIKKDELLVLIQKYFKK